MRLAGLHRLYTRPGPWASAYLDVSRDAEDAAVAIELRWRGLREQLSGQGATVDTLTAMDRALDEAPPVVGRGGLAMFAAGGQAVPAQELPDPPAADNAEVAPLPRVRDLVAARDPVVRWVRAVVDRTGADVSTVDSGWVGAEGSTDYPIRKTAPGGWSQPRYQRAAETSWDRNAMEMAEAVAQAADQVGADVVVLAGDVRARQLVVSRLPRHLVDRVVQTDAGGRAGGRAGGSEPETLDELTAQVVRDEAGRRRSAMLDRFRTDLANGTAVAGLPAVLDAARQRRIGVLLLSQSDRDGTLWIDPDRPDLLATSPVTLRELGARQAVAEDRDAALLAAVAFADGEATIADDLWVPAGAPGIPDGGPDGGLDGGPVRPGRRAHPPKGLARPPHRDVGVPDGVGAILR